MINSDVFGGCRLKYLVVLFFLGSSVFSQAGSRWLEAAIDAAEWIDSTEICWPGGGVYWPSNPEKPSDSAFFYKGNAGIVLFYTRLYEVSGQERWLQKARDGADYMIDVLPEKDWIWPDSGGLQGGFGGISFSFHNLYKASGDKKYLDAAVNILHLLTQKVGTPINIENLGATTDIMGGYAGFGLAHLYAHEQGYYGPSLKLAEAAGDQLLFEANMLDGYMYWWMKPDYPKNLPNFSHGTAGIAYFLARLYQVTGKQRFLDAALSGANYLLQLQNEQGLICHSEPDGQDLFYMGWCHGPVGTVRLYYLLAEVTDDKKWLKPVAKSFDAVLAVDLDEKRTPGFWNNISQCCGSAGVAACALDLSGPLQRPDYKSYAYRLTEDILDRAERTQHGLKWTQAEHRIRPEFLEAQTGFMQGAAGVGYWLLQLHAHEKGMDLNFQLPDSPY